MSSRQLFVPLGDADTLVQKLLDVGNSLKPIDDTNYYFFEIVRELVDAAIKNFTELRRGYVAGNLNLIAWASRNLLELTVFTKYVLKSGANARRFGDDRLIDGWELIVSLRDLEHFYDPSAPTPGLDDALKRARCGVFDDPRLDCCELRTQIERAAITPAQLLFGSIPHCLNVIHSYLHPVFTRYLARYRVL
jgi:hypothetical protein